MFQSQLNRHISSSFKKFCTGGAKMWRFSGRMWSKTSQVKKQICMRERHILPRKATNVTRHIVCHWKKWQMWRYSPKSETGSWEEIRVRPTLKHTATLRLDRTLRCKSLLHMRDTHHGMNLIEKFIRTRYVSFKCLFVPACVVRVDAQSRTQVFSFPNISFVEQWKSVTSSCHWSRRHCQRRHQSTTKRVHHCC